MNKLLPGTERLKTDSAYARQFAARQEKNRKPGKKAISLAPKKGVEALHLAYAQSVRTIHADKTLTQEGRRIKLEQLNKEQNQKLTEYFKRASDSATIKLKTKPVKSGN